MQQKYYIVHKFLHGRFVGSFNAEVLSPSGKLKVDLKKPVQDQIEVAFTAKEEGTNL